MYIHMYVHNASSSALWRQPRTPRKGQPPSLHPCAQGCMYISWLPSFDLLTYIHTYICTYTPLYIHMYIHIFQDDKAKVSQGWMALPGSLGVHNPPSGIPTHKGYLFTYICTYLHTYTYTHICTNICTYILEGSSRRPQESSWNLHNLDPCGLHTYVFRSHLGTISVKGRVPLEPVGRSTSQRR